jgi:iron(III) transport system substrate-binding protein
MWRRMFVLLTLLLLVLPLGGARNASAQSDAFAALVAAAKAEGSVVVDGPPLDPVRNALTQDFEHAYGIPVSYVSGGGSQSAARVRAERAAGKYLLDVFVSGSDTPLLTFLPSGWLDRIEPALIAPDVIDPRKWLDGHLWYADDQHTILRVILMRSPELAINTKLVKPNEVSTWQSLLDPKWQGKIIAKDPSIAGAGAVLTVYFYMEFGPDFVRKLYRDQKPLISRDPRQMVQWLAQGTAPILVGPDFVTLAAFQKLGYPVAAIFPQGPEMLTGGWGLVSLVNRAPHPNAAKLFVNWLASKAGQDSFANASIEVSLRTDVTYHDIPPYMFPQKNHKYVDLYDAKFVSDRDAALEKARALLNL